MPSSRPFFVINPTAGRGRSRKLWDALQTQLTQKKYGHAFTEKARPSRRAFSLAHDTDERMTLRHFLTTQDFSRPELDAMLDMGLAGCDQIRAMQQAALGAS